jgi:hypothetical protein
MFGRKAYELFKRKSLAALYASILLTVVFEVFSVAETLIYFKDDYSLSDPETIISISFILLFASIGNFIYGLPVSLIAEYITKSMEGRKPLLFSFSIHVFFGFITVFFLGRLGVLAIISSILFF